jgi:hypothetical protein
MFLRQDRVLPALGFIAAAFVLIALFMRPSPLPTDEASYTPTAVAVPVAANRRPTVGLTYAIDSLEVDGVQRQIGDLTPIRTSQPIIVHGWAVLPATMSPGKQLLMSLDGAPAVPVSAYGIARPDVGAAINPAATNSGFSARLAVQHLRRGRHTLQFVLEGADGRRVQLPTAVRFVL